MGSVSVSSCRCCMFVSCVHPVAVLNAAFCMTCSLLMLVEDALGTDHHQLIMPPISKDCSNTFLERSFIYAAPCEWNKLSEHIRTSNFDCFRKC